jgi:Ca2+-binding RTX toxin-like protein
MPRIVEAFAQPSGTRIADPPGAISGTNGADFLWGTESDDYISGKDGNDRLKGGGGADELWGGAGIDTVYYGDSAVGVAVNLATGQGFGGSAEGDTLISIEYVFGSFHNDTITGNDANNELYGLTGNDVLKGGGGADGLGGDDGDDILKGGGGADYLEGGAGGDTVDYSTSNWTPLGGGGVSVNLDGNRGSYGDAEGDTFSGIEHVTGTPYQDSLIGTGDNNRLRGLDGPDYLYGLGGNDILEGGSDSDSLIGNEGDDTLRGDLGNDHLSGGIGVDTMIGGDGNDYYYIVDDTNDVVIESGGQGNDTVWSGVSLTLTAGADVETLRAISDAGSDPIALTGNANGNEVIGNNGDNVIAGGGGNDYLTGRGGQDAFLFDTAHNVASNVDVIMDFNVAEDTIWLDDEIFTSGLLAGNSVAGSQFVIGTAALDAGDRIVYNNATGAVLYDSDGTGPTAAIQFARLSAGLALTNFDFFVVP